MPASSPATEQFEDKVYGVCPSSCALPQVNALSVVFMVLYPVGMAIAARVMAVSLRANVRVAKGGRVKFWRDGLKHL